MLNAMALYVKDAPQVVITIVTSNSNEDCNETRPHCCNAPLLSAAEYNREAHHAAGPIRTEIGRGGHGGEAHVARQRQRGHRLVCRLLCLPDMPQHRLFAAS